jgi:hypothetical protein
MKLVARYDNGSGHMEWAASPVQTMAEAIVLIQEGWQSHVQDVIAVNVADGDRWSEGEVVAQTEACGYCGNSELREFSKISIHGELHKLDAHSCGYCGGV